MILGSHLQVLENTFAALRLYVDYDKSHKHRHNILLFLCRTFKMGFNTLLEKYQTTIDVI